MARIGANCIPLILLVTVLSLATTVLASEKVYSENVGTGHQHQRHLVGLSSLWERLVSSVSETNTKNNGSEDYITVDDTTIFPTESPTSSIEISSSSSKTMKLDQCLARRMVACHSNEGRLDTIEENSSVVRVSPLHKVMLNGSGLDEIPEALIGRRSTGDDDRGDTIGIRSEKEELEAMYIDLGINKAIKHDKAEEDSSVESVQSRDKLRGIKGHAVLSEKDFKIRRLDEKKGSTSTASTSRTSKGSVESESSSMTRVSKGSQMSDSGSGSASKTANAPQNSDDTSDSKGVTSGDSDGSATVQSEESGDGLFSNFFDFFSFLNPANILNIFDFGLLDGDGGLLGTLVSALFVKGGIVLVADLIFRLLPGASSLIPLASTTQVSQGGLGLPTLEDEIVNIEGRLGTIFTSSQPLESRKAMRSSIMLVSTDASNPRIVDVIILIVNEFILPYGAGILERIGVADNLITFLPLVVTLFPSILDIPILNAVLTLLAQPNMQVNSRLARAELDNALISVEKILEDVQDVDPTVYYEALTCEMQVQLCERTANLDELLIT